MSEERTRVSSAGSARRSAVGRAHLPSLQQLEAESIHSLREVAAEFAKPLMLYSIGKDCTASSWRSTSMRRSPSASSAIPRLRCALQDFWDRHGLFRGRYALRAGCWSVGLTILLETVLGPLWACLGPRSSSRIQLKRDGLLGFGGLPDINAELHTSLE